MSRCNRPTCIDRKFKRTRAKRSSFIFSSFVAGGGGQLGGRGRSGWAEAKPFRTAHEGKENDRLTFLYPLSPLRKLLLLLAFRFAAHTHRHALTASVTIPCSLTILLIPVCPARVVISDTRTEWLIVFFFRYSRRDGQSFSSVCKTE